MKMQIPLEFNHDENTVGAFIDFQKQIIEFIKAMVEFYHNKFQEGIIENDKEKENDSINNLVIFFAMQQWHSTIFSVLLSGDYNLFNKYDQKNLEIRKEAFQILENLKKERKN